MTQMQVDFADTLFLTVSEEYFFNQDQYSWTSVYRNYKIIVYRKYKDVCFEFPYIERGQKYILGLFNHTFLKEKTCFQTEFSMACSIIPLKSFYTPLKWQDARNKNAEVAAFSHSFKTFVSPSLLSKKTFITLLKHKIYRLQLEIYHLSFIIYHYSICIK